MYSKRDENRPGGGNDYRPAYNTGGRPAPLPEGFALYYIAAVCPANINEKISSYKQYLQSQYGCRAAQKSPAHLTIVPPFKAEEDLEPLLTGFIQDYSRQIVAFDIQLQGFNHFNRRVLFVDVAPNEKLADMESNVNLQFSEQFPSIIFRTKPDFHPHVTIATRDIPEHKFDEIWNYFSEGASIKDSFQCSAISLLKLRQGLWSSV